MRSGLLAGGGVVHLKKMYQEVFFAFLFFRHNQDFIPSMFSLEKGSVGSWVSREESCTSRAPKYKNLDSDPCSAVCKLIKLDHTFFSCILHR